MADYRANFFNKYGWNSPVKYPVVSDDYDSGKKPINPTYTPSSPSYRPMDHDPYLDMYRSSEMYWKNPYEEGASNYNWMYDFPLPEPIEQPAPSSHRHGKQLVLEMTGKELRESLRQEIYDINLGCDCKGNLEGEESEPMEDETSEAMEAESVGPSILPSHHFEEPYINYDWKENDLYATDGRLAWPVDSPFNDMMTGQRAPPPRYGYDNEKPDSLHEYLDRSIRETDELRHDMSEATLKYEKSQRKLARSDKRLKKARTKLQNERTEIKGAGDKLKKAGVKFSKIGDKCQELGHLMEEIGSP